MTADQNWSHLGGTNNESPRFYKTALTMKSRLGSGSMQPLEMQLADVTQEFFNELEAFRCFGNRLWSEAS